MGGVTGGPRRADVQRQERFAAWLALGGSGAVWCCDSVPWWSTEGVMSLSSQSSVAEKEVGGVDSAGVLKLLDELWLGRVTEDLRERDFRHSTNGSLARCQISDRRCELLREDDMVW